MGKERKIKIPKSVTELRLSPKKFAKKHDIRLKGKGLKKKDRKRNLKRLTKEYSASAIEGINKAVKILVETSKESKKIEKIKTAVENIITNPNIMKEIPKLYKKDKSSYGNLIYLPHMIMNTLVYYNQETLSDDEKKIGESLDKEALLSFCEKILKKEIKAYRNAGLSQEAAFQMASVIPTGRLLKDLNRKWYRKLIQAMYTIAETEPVHVDEIIRGIMKTDKKAKIKKSILFEGLFSEFMLNKPSNKNHKFTDTQKELHEKMLELTLEYLNTIKRRKCKEVMKRYIKRRKTAEKYKNDSKRVIKFIDYANSNSEYTNLKQVLLDIIADNASNELYLS